MLTHLNSAPTNVDIPTWSDDFVLTISLHTNLFQQIFDYCILLPLPSIIMTFVLTYLQFLI